MSDFDGLFDTDRAAYYSVKLNKDKTITIKFYDDKKKAIKSYGK